METLKRDNGYFKKSSRAIFAFMLHLFYVALAECEYMNVCLKSQIIFLKRVFPFFHVPFLTFKPCWVAKN